MEEQSGVTVLPQYPYMMTYSTCVRQMHWRCLKLEVTEYKVRRVKTSFCSVWMNSQYTFTVLLKEIDSQDFRLQFLSRNSILGPKSSISIFFSRQIAEYWRFIDHRVNCWSRYLQHQNGFFASNRGIKNSLMWSFARATHDMTSMTKGQMTWLRSQTRATGALGGYKEMSSILADQ